MLPYRFVAYDPKCLWSFLLTLGPTIALGAGRRHHLWFFRLPLFLAPWLTGNSLQRPPVL